MIKAIRSLFRKHAPPQLEQRDFMGAAINRLTFDWDSSISTADTELRAGLKTMRARVRSMERDNDHMKAFLRLTRNNVLGHKGVKLQMKVKEEQRNRMGQFVEVYDRRANAIIERHWRQWSKLRFCTVNRCETWKTVQELALTTAVRDGAVLARLHYPSWNPYRFSVELLEPDHLDVDYEATLTGGRMIRLGVEYNAEGQVEAYHILRNHPGASYTYLDNRRWRERVPASEMMQLYRPDRIKQSTGNPWASAAMFDLQMLKKYEESEAVAARVAAAKMGFFVRDPQQNSVGAGYVGAKDGRGNRVMEAEPGAFDYVPDGFRLETFDPNHPNALFGDFVKAKLRSIASGLGVSYTSFANDLESVNYSSIRAGLLEEREEWKTVQEWFVEYFVEPIFTEWLRVSLIAGALSDEVAALPAAKFEKFNTPVFVPRRWDWVDPLKDQQADQLAIENGLTSRRRVISERGDDIEEIDAEQEADAALAAQHGREYGKKPEPEQQKPVDEEEKENGKD